MRKGDVVSWFSCGAASAYASKLAHEVYGDRLNVVYCDTMSSEHPDNHRFLLDVQEWIGVEIKILKSTRFGSVDEVFEKRRIMSTINGAPCTVEMKKKVRFDFQGPTDTHIFGMTIEEERRIKQFSANNFELSLHWILLENRVSKKDCLRAIVDAGIEIPKMYKLGYKNNNCIGCVKATSPAYWNMVRRDFPEIFNKRVEQSRRLGSRLVKIDGERRFLHELELLDNRENGEDLSCGPQCGGGGGE